MGCGGDLTVRAGDLGARGGGGELGAGGGGGDMGAGGRGEDSGAGGGEELGSDGVKIMYGVRERRDSGVNVHG